MIGGAGGGGLGGRPPFFRGEETGGRLPFFLEEAEAGGRFRFFRWGDSVGGSFGGSQLRSWGAFG